MLYVSFQYMLTGLSLFSQGDPEKPADSDIDNSNFLEENQAK